MEVENIENIPSNFERRSARPLEGAAKTGVQLRHAISVSRVAAQGALAARGRYSEGAGI